MPQLRLALVQANPTVGDLRGNADLVTLHTRAAIARGAHVVAFPEMFLTGYPVEDLALRPSFVEASAHRIHLLAQALKRRGAGDVPVVVGYLDAAPEPATTPGVVPARRAQNCAAVLYDGKVVGRYAKHHLPNYGVFDEARYFVPGDAPLVVRIDGVDVALAVCEDLWQHGGPVAEARELEAALLLVLNASPYERDKDDVRLELVQRRAAEAGCALAYVNMTGAQDDLVFDGDSLVVGADGALLARAPQFADDILVIDLDLPAATSVPGPHHVVIDLTDADEDARAARATPAPAQIAPRIVDEEEIYTALVTGLRDYVEKVGFPSVVLGLSGGIDSALVAAIACDALGAERVFGVLMPSKYSSDHSIDDANELAARCGMYSRTIPIEPMVDAFVTAVGLEGVAEENVQARVRGTTLMGLSNSDGHLVLATGNKSELSVGYSTIYGDAVGGFAPLKDVPKTLVWKLARWRNAVADQLEQVPPIPLSSIEKAPSAELRPGQTDQDTLPSYEVLDAILEAYVGADRGAKDLADEGQDPELVATILQMVDRAEWKRRQYPPGPKISGRAFGRDRRLPITSAWTEASGVEPAVAAATAPTPQLDPDSPCA
jgi:NAD+ synthase (glutamine-hydrolysing)